MKTIIIAFSLFLFALNSNASKGNKKNTDSIKQKKVVIDAISNEQSQSTLDVNHNERVEIVVNNINPFIYNITVKESQRDYLKEIENRDKTPYNHNLAPLLFNIPEIEYGFISLPEKKESNKTEGGKANKSISDNLQEIQAQINKRYKEEYNPLYDQFMSSNDSSEKIDLKNKMDNFDNSIAPLILKRKGLREEQKSITREVKGKEINDKGNQFAFRNCLEDYNIQLNELRKIYQFHQQLITLVSNPNATIDKLIQDKKELITTLYPARFITTKNKTSRIFQAYYTHKDSLDKILGKLNQIYTEVVLLEIKDEFTNQLLMNMKTTIEKLKENNVKLNSTSMQDDIAEIIGLYNAIEKPLFQIKFYTSEIEDKTDDVIYSISTEPKMNLKTNILPKPMNYSIKLNIKGGIQMNVSSGFFFNVGLSRNKYSFEKNETDSNYHIERVKRKNSDLFTPAFGLLLHVYKRSPETVKLAGTLGIATSDANSLKYFLGGSVIIGKSQRFVISGGFAGTKIEYLKFPYNLEKKTYTESQVKLLEEFPTEGLFRIGGFLGISFNFFGKKTPDFESVLPK